MEATVRDIKHGWVWALSLLIFFFNTFPLPEGLTYTLLLTPVWIYILYTQQRLAAAGVLLLPLLGYAAIHLMLGVNISYYFISFTMLAALVLFLLVANSYITSPHVNWDLIFRDIAILNFFLSLLSLVLLSTPFLKPLVWYLVPISPNVPPVPRLKLFTSEASHYSFWLAPVAIYFYSRALFFKSKGMFLTLLIVTLPLLMSFSLGVLSCLLITAVLIALLYFQRVFSSPGKRTALVLVAIGMTGALAAAYILFPHNPLFARLHNIWHGNDTSARGRTYEAFILAHKIARQKSLLWGIGPGQLKVLGRNIIVQYYFYSHIPETVRLPNASGETIAYFGYVGFALRLLLEAFLFFRTRVYRNPYRMWLFLFVFIYQFTGSYISNPAEYLVWLLAFSSIFPEYEEKNNTLTQAAVV